MSGIVAHMYFKAEPCKKKSNCILKHNSTGMKTKTLEPLVNTDEDIDTQETLVNTHRHQKDTGKHRWRQRHQWDSDKHRWGPLVNMYDHVPEPPACCHWYRASCCWWTWSAVSAATQKTACHAHHSVFKKEVDSLVQINRIKCLYLGNLDGDKVWFQ